MLPSPLTSPALPSSPISYIDILFEISIYERDILHSKGMPPTTTDRRLTALPTRSSVERNANPYWPAVIPGHEPLFESSVNAPATGGSTRSYRTRSHYPSEWTSHANRVGRLMDTKWTSIRWQRSEPSAMFFPYLLRCKKQRLVGAWGLPVTIALVGECMRSIGTNHRLE